MLGLLLPATIDMMEKLAESYKATIAVFHGIIATWLFKVFSAQLDEFYFVDCRAGSGAGKPDTGRSHGLASADTARQTTLRSAQAHPGAGVRHHQIGDGIPPIPAARVTVCSALKSCELADKQTAKNGHPRRGEVCYNP
jgi:hypothetical protein